MINEEINKSTKPTKSPEKLNNENQTATFMPIIHRHSSILTLLIIICKFVSANDSLHNLARTKIKVCLHYFQ